MEEQHQLLITALPRLPATTREKSFQLPSLMHAHTRSHVPQLPGTLAHSQPDLQHSKRGDLGGIFPHLLVTLSAVSEKQEEDGKNSTGCCINPRATLMCEWEVKEAALDKQGGGFKDQVLTADGLIAPFLTAESGMPQRWRSWVWLKQLGQLSLEEVVKFQTH